MIPLPFTRPSSQERARFPGYGGYLPSKADVKSPDKDPALTHGPKYSESLIPKYQGYIPGLRETFGKGYTQGADLAKTTIRKGPTMDDTEAVTVRIDRSSISDPSPSLLQPTFKDKCLKDKLSVPGYGGFIPQKHFLHGKSNKRIIDEAAELNNSLKRPINSNEPSSPYSPRPGSLPGYCGHVPGLNTAVGTSFGKATCNLNKFN
ncbi:hypothetical protein P9112_005891 [Eukaryota sp. TZLM1-RC]